MNPKLHIKIAKLVGYQLLIKFIVNDKEFEVLMLESFLGTKVTDLKIKAANNTEIDIDGII